MKTCLASILLFSGIINSQVPKVTSGKIQHIENFKSQFVDARNVDVWLPDGYSDKEKYAVLYMHDGQALFDADLNWNHQSWDADETAGSLNAGTKTKKFIIVGIWNNGMKRHGEYFPQKPYEKLTDEQKKFVSDKLLEIHMTDKALNVSSDNYLKFLVNELKPYIDSHFSTMTDKENTFIVGSSMGGLISMYAICEYPDVFGGAACLSTHWTGIHQLENNPVPDVFFEYLKTHLPDPKDHKFYFDFGDKTLDALYTRLQKRADYALYQGGYTADDNWKTQYFPGKDHSEKSWAERLNIPLEFLLKK